MNENGVLFFLSAVSYAETGIALLSEGRFDNQSRIVGVCREINARTSLELRLRWNFDGCAIASQREI